MAAKERTKENCRCFDAADPRLGGCTPPSPPKRRSEVSAAKRTQYYCPFLTPPSLPPLLSREFPPTPAAGNSRPSGPGMPAPQPTVATRQRATTAHYEGAGCRPPLPLSSATRSRQSVGRGLDPSAAFRPTIVTGSSVGEGFIPPGAFAFPLNAGPPPPTLSQLYHTLFPPPLQGVVKISLQFFLSICVIIEKV